MKNSRKNKIQERIAWIGLIMLFIFFLATACTAPKEFIYKDSYKSLYENTPKQNKDLEQILKEERSVDNE